MGANQSAEREVEAARRYRTAALSSSQGHIRSPSDGGDTGPVHGVGLGHGLIEHVQPLAAIPAGGRGTSSAALIQRAEPHRRGEATMRAMRTMSSLAQPLSNSQAQIKTWSESPNAPRLLSHTNNNTSTDEEVSFSEALRIVKTPIPFSSSMPRITNTRLRANPAPRGQGAASSGGNTAGPSKAPKKISAAVKKSSSAVKKSSAALKKHAIKYQKPKNSVKQNNEENKKKYTPEELDFARGKSDNYATLARGVREEAFARAVWKYTPKGRVATIAREAKKVYDELLPEAIAGSVYAAQHKIYAECFARAPDFKPKNCKTTTYHTEQNPQDTNISRNLPCFGDDELYQLNQTSSSEPTDMEDENRVRKPLGVDSHIETTHKWEYTIVCTENAQDLTPGDDIKNHARRLPGSFMKRDEANAELEKITSYDQFDDTTHVVQRRYTYEHTPFKLLKVELTLATGEQRVLWVERRLVDLKRDLKQSEKKMKKWSAKRPRLPHYVVECEFIRQVTAEEPQQQRWDEGVMDMDIDTDVDAVGGGATAVPPREVVGGFNRDIELNRLPLTTFTVRELANEYAAELFLLHSAVREETRGPYDDYWWVQSALPIHREAEGRAKGVGSGLYVADLDTDYMRTRLGFDRLRVSVHAVDDVAGPLNI
ncbi:hypothetical protein F5B20DRAFT_587906 [Whalleya microplaca]|nr:hypothetical protein F5B20DRAFT_587906 [Whalleya microplaca]